MIPSGSISSRNRLLILSKPLEILIILIQALLFACVSSFDGYAQMAWISSVQLMILIGILLLSPRGQSFSILFLVANWVFHCGQLICLANGNSDSLNLDIRWYGSTAEIAEAFRYYFYAQSLIASGAILFQDLTPKGNARLRFSRFSFTLNTKVAFTLFAVGLPFRLYVDSMRIMGASLSGYEGVYSLVIPSIVQAAAFYCDAACLMFLLLLGKQRKSSLLFWTVCIYKLILMSTGARQEAFCFIAVWVFLYFGYIRKLSLARLIVLIMGSLALLFAVDAFGELRTQGFSFAALQVYFTEHSVFDAAWDSLGEFGCALSTLIVSIVYVPQLVDFGMGSSYIAGLMSVVPTLVNRFAGLKASTLFTTMLPGTSFFGGSMLGELYFNFGWIGLLGTFAIGGIVAACQNSFNDYSGRDITARVWVASVMAVFLLLYIRGYFTDAVMKFVYTLLFARCSSGLITHFQNRSSGLQFRDDAI